MNFRQVATEIMLTANEEKWQETRDKIEKALKKARYAGIIERHKHAPDDQRWFRAAVVGAEVVAVVPTYSIDHWRDQPDGVR